jgi:hypothetical protein
MDEGASGHPTPFGDSVSESSLTQEPKNAVREQEEIVLGYKLAREVSAELNGRIEPGERATRATQR